jgi:LuxR family maltose regulon positive regulatory protein
VLGAAEPAIADLTAAVEGGDGASETAVVAHAQLALMAIRRGAWNEAGQHERAGQAVVEDAGLGDYATSALVHVATARVALHEGRQQDARAAMTAAHRLRPLLDYGLPWLTMQVGIELARAHLALAEPGPARTVLGEAEQVLDVRPQLGVLVEDAQELRDHVAATSGPDGAWAMSLTGAELRLLPYLATHLTFPGIASRLFISRNTVKSEAVSIYRKLGVSSRSDAIERAVEVGLLDDSIYPRPPNLIPEG